MNLSFVPDPGSRLHFRRAVLILKQTFILHTQSKKPRQRYAVAKWPFIAYRGRTGGREGEVHRCKVTSIYLALYIMCEQYPVSKMEKSILSSDIVVKVLKHLPPELPQDLKGRTALFSQMFTLMKKSYHPTVSFCTHILYNVYCEKHLS